MRDATTAREVILTMESRPYLHAFLEYYWLRPETALWRSLDCMALRDVDFRSPVLDVGCGDGVFSFLRAGGTLDCAYDAFLQVGKLDAFFEKVDIYDHFREEAIAPTVVRRPRYMIDVGVDHKEALLKKAKATGVYREVRVGNANEGLPVESGRFRTVYSNMLYWLEGYRTCLREIARALAHDGLAVLQVPAETFRDYLLYPRLYGRTGDPKWAWLELIDRGRSENIKHCKSREEWTSEFAEAGLTPVGYRRYMSRTVLEAWDIGLRPLSPFLIEMANKLTPTDRAAIKAKWVDGIMPLIEPLCELEWVTDKDYPPGFHMFVLEKTRQL